MISTQVKASILMLLVTVVLGFLWRMDALASERDRLKNEVAQLQVKSFVDDVSKFALSWRLSQQPKIRKEIEYRETVIERRVQSDPAFAECENQLLPVEYVDSLWPEVYSASSP